MLIWKSVLNAFHQFVFAVPLEDELPRSVHAAELPHCLIGATKEHSEVKPLRHQAVSGHGIILDAARDKAALVGPISNPN